MRDRLLQISIAKGIDFKFNSSIDAIERAEHGGLRLTMAGCDDIVADEVLYAVGRKPNIEGLGLEALDIAIGERGEIKVDSAGRTNVPSVFAIGDVTDRIQLTPNSATSCRSRWIMTACQAPSSVTRRLPAWG
jgi:glutathione reductase (NADPH)